jgi:glucokinase
MQAPEPTYVIGIDVGGTRIKSGAVTRQGEMLASAVSPSGYTLAAPKLVEVLAEEVERIEVELGARPGAVVLGLSGAVNPETGVVLLPGKMKDIENYPLVPRLARRLGIEVVAENDGRISILAEAHYGLAKGHNWAVTITIGTGVGSGVLLDGRVLRDPHLQFGNQVGHLIMDDRSDDVCITGGLGTIETLCSAKALEAKVQFALTRGLNSVLTDAFFEDPQSIDFKAIVEAVRSGDPLCTDAFVRWKRHLGWMLINAVHAYAPEIVILSGGPTNAADLFLDDVRNHVNKHVYRYPRGEPVEIVLSKLKDHAGVLGAAAVAWERVDAHG